MNAKEIHPELRLTGRVTHFFFPHFNRFTLKLTAKLSGISKIRLKRKTSFKQETIQRPDGSRLRLCIYTPKEPRENVPGLLWMHGGGYALGVPEEDEGFFEPFIEKTGCVVVAPDYTLSFSKPYPAALEDCYLALLWLRDQATDLGVRDDQIFIGGESAGGGLTAALAIYARAKKEVKIAYMMPIYPMLDDRPTDTNVNNDAPIWNSKSNDVAWQVYLGEYFQKAEIPDTAVPARCKDYRDLPPVCTYVGTIEPFYAETKTLVENLKAAGVPVFFREFPGCFHAFDISCPKSTPAKEARAFLLDCFCYASKHYFKAQGQPQTQG